MDATTLAVMRHTYNKFKKRPLDHNGRSGTITVEAGEWCALLAWFKLALDALDVKADN